MYPTNMSHNHVSSNPMLEQRVLDIIQHCEAICEFTESMVDPSHRREQLRLLRDCADICTLTAKYVARHSIFAKSLAMLCAHICEAYTC